MASNSFNFSFQKIVVAFVALLTLCIGLALASQYPLGAAWAVAGFALVTAAAARLPYLWLVMVPGLLPLIDLAPWSGWITFEEFDLLVLACATGGYARMAWKGMRRPVTISPPSALFTWMSCLLFIAVTLLDMLRGFDDAGGFVFGMFQGYHEPMNSVRLAKSFLLAWLLIPLWRQARLRDPQASDQALVAGMLLGLGAVSLLTIWERLAFTGLLNFSSDYRTTAMFWEMHVGGAALDGFLALTAPFAVYRLLTAHSNRQWALAGGVLALGSYACLTTFSRGVYLAIPVGLVSLVALQVWQKRKASTGTEQSPVRLVATAAGDGIHIREGAWLIGGFALCCFWMFGSSGYRGMLAFAVCMALLLRLAGVVHRMAAKDVIIGLLWGLMASVLASLLAWMAAKGAYVAFGMAAGVAGIAVLLHPNKELGRLRPLLGKVAVGGFVAAATSMLLVGLRWGEMQGLLDALPALLLLLGLFAWALGLTGKTGPVWPESGRWQGTVLGIMLVLGAITGVMGGGAYMGKRFSTGAQDFNGRMSHWQQSLEGLRSTSEWLLGRGLGRFPDSQILSDQEAGHPGDFRLVQSESGSYISLSSGKLQNLGHDSLFKVSQRLALPPTPLHFSAKLRSDNGAQASVEVCEKHLLYQANCVGQEISVAALPGKWQDVQVELKGDTLSRGSWYAPRLIVFSIMLHTAGAVVQFDDLRLSGPNGQNLLANGDFSNGLAHWFSSSDKNHLPWHLKNIFLNVLFDQGVLGLIIWSLLIGAALAHLVRSDARLQPLAPVFVASILSFITVGLFDSLLDVPRLATLFYFTVLAALTLPLPAQDSLQRESRVRSHHKGQTLHKRSRLKIALLSCSAILLFGWGASVLLVSSEGKALSDLAHVTPAQWIRYAQLRLKGHSQLEAALLPTLLRLQTLVERPVPPGELPTLGKGQTREAYKVPPVEGKAMEVGSTEELRSAMMSAQAGSIIQLKPGSYRVESKLNTKAGGTENAPIVVKAARPGTVNIEMATVEGFKVTQPYWVFENLDIRGTCKEDSDCEHAFHVVGDAHHVVIRNNRIEDFNAQIKVNGEGGKWPDEGLLQHNTLNNSRARQTKNPVTPLDLVGANHWTVSDNLVSNFVKDGGNGISYGMFMKGAESGGRFERNLVICTTSNISQPGLRVGLSWGGGTTGKGLCRDSVCAAEALQSVAANNVVAHCNDAGLDVNRGKHIQLLHNTLVNTAGVSIRGASEDVSLVGNLLEGRIKNINGTGISLVNNDVLDLPKVLQDPDRLQLARRGTAVADLPRISELPTDFCGRARSDMTFSGAMGVGQLPCAVQ